MNRKTVVVIISSVAGFIAFLLILSNAFELFGLYASISSQRNLERLTKSPI